MSSEVPGITVKIEMENMGELDIAIRKAERLVELMTEVKQAAVAISAVKMSEGQ